jgi:hypothetical protein
MPYFRCHASTAPARLLLSWGNFQPPSFFQLHEKTRREREKRPSSSSSSNPFGQSKEQKFWLPLLPFKANPGETDLLGPKSTALVPYIELISPPLCSTYRDIWCNKTAQQGAEKITKLFQFFRVKFSSILQRLFWLLLSQDESEISWKHLWSTCLQASC